MVACASTPASGLARIVPSVNYRLPAVRARPLSTGRRRLEVVIETSSEAALARLTVWSCDVDEALVDAVALAARAGVGDELDELRDFGLCAIETDSRRYRRAIPSYGFSAYRRERPTAFAASTSPAGSSASIATTASSAAPSGWVPNGSCS